MKALTEYKFSLEDLKTWFYSENLINPDLDFLVKTICDIKGLDFNKCSNVRIEEYDLYSPKLIFNYSKL